MDLKISRKKKALVRNDFELLVTQTFNAAKVTEQFPSPKHKTVLLKDTPWPVSLNLDTSMHNAIWSQFFPCHFTIRSQLKKVVMSLSAF